MSDPHITEDEQTEKLKLWWKENGTSVVVGIALGLGIVVGVNWWRDFTQTQESSASSLYEQMMVLHRDGKIESAELAGAKLMKDHTSLAYAGKAALFMAKISFGKKDLTSARSQLQWAIDNAKEPSVVHSARLKLVQLDLDGGKYEEALKRLQAKDTGGFETHYQELRGDTYSALGKTAQARKAYKQALETLPKASTYRELMAMKLDSVGGSETN